MLNFASAFVVTVIFAFPVNWSAGISITIASDFASVGVPAILIVALASLAFTCVLICAVNPVGKFVNQLETSVSAASSCLNVSPDSVMVTSASLIGESFVPVTSTFPTVALAAADGFVPSCFA